MKPIEQMCDKKKYLTPPRICCMIHKVRGFCVQICACIRCVVEMDKIFEQALLYDFYGELLTEHQRNVYEDVVFNDMSLSEIAAEQGISRQGVHDMIKRCDKILQSYESKLHLVARFSAAKEKIGEIVKLTGEPQSGDSLQRIRELSMEIMEEL